MRLLIVTPRVPWPLEKGDKLRAYHQIRILSKSYKICLCCLADGPVHPDSLKQLNEIADEVHIIKLNKVFIVWRLFLAFFSSKPFQIHYFYQRGAHKKLRKIISEFKPERIYCQLIRAAEYVKHLHEVPKTIDYMDAFNMGHSRRLKGANFFMRFLLKEEAARLARYENLIFEYFERHTIISEQDRELIFHPHRDRIEVISNGVDLDFFKKDSSFSISNDVLFTGNMAYPPNVDCAVFLALEVMPLVRKIIPNARLKIAGANPTSEVKKCAGDFTEVTGWMNDIREAYSTSLVFAAPMRIGTGLQNKLLEAMAMDLPCVTSLLAARAMDAKDREECIIAENPQEVANAIVELITNIELRHHLCRNAKEHIQKHFSWEGTVHKLSNIIKSSHERED
jgi:polysaccharide biosynthesis protein PslH